MERGWSWRAVDSERETTRERRQWLKETLSQKKQGWRPRKEEDKDTEEDTHRKKKRHKRKRRAGEK